MTISKILGKMGAHFRGFTVTTIFFSISAPPCRACDEPPNVISQKFEKKIFSPKIFLSPLEHGSIAENLTSPFEHGSKGEFAVSGWLETLSGGHEARPKSIDVRRESTGVQQRRAGEARPV